MVVLFRSSPRICLLLGMAVMGCASAPMTDNPRYKPRSGVELQQQTSQPAAALHRQFVRTQRQWRIGDKGVLDEPWSQKQALLGETYLDLVRMVKLLAAGDTYGVGEMMSERRVIEASPGDPFLVIDVLPDAVEVRLQAGRSFGKSGFVPTQWIADGWDLANE
jgi:hypothetical protein